MRKIAIVIVLQDFVDTLVKKAYENWRHVIEYDGKALLNIKQSKKASTSPNKPPSVSPTYHVSYDQQVQVSRPQISVTAPIVHPSLDATGASGGNELLELFKQIIRLFHLLF